MKIYFVIISIMIIFLIPLNAIALTDDAQPFVSAYTAVHNSNGEFVGVIHFNTLLPENSAIFSPEIFAKIPITKNITIDDLKYQISDPIQSKRTVGIDVIPQSEFFDTPDNELASARCAQPYANIFDVCSYYWKTTRFAPILETNSATEPVLEKRLNVKTGEIELFLHGVVRSTATLFTAIHHGFIVEEGDTVNTSWTFLIPAN